MKVHIHSTAFAHTAFSGAVVTDRAAVQFWQQQTKHAHTNFIAYSRSYSSYMPFKIKWSPPS